MKKNLLLVSLSLIGISINAQWIDQASNFTVTSRGIFDLQAVNANVAWAVAYDGSGGNQPVQDFTRTIDGGNTWTAGQVGPAVALGLSFSNISAIDGNTAFVSMYDPNGPGGWVYKTTDGGTTWTQVCTTCYQGNAAFANVVYFWDGTRGWTMGDPNGNYFEIWLTNDGGTTWTRVPQNQIPNPAAGEYGYTNVFDVEGNTIWFGTNKGRVYKSTDGGNNWTVDTIAPNTYSVGDVVFRDANSGLAWCYLTSNPATNDLRRSGDGGANWSVVTTTGSYHRNDLENIPGSYTYICTGAAAGDEGSGYSVDGGTSWVNLEGPTPPQRLALGFVNGTTGWAGGFNDINNPLPTGMFKFDGSINLGTNNVTGKEMTLQVYPNPGNGMFMLKINNSEKEPLHVNVSNALGQVVYSSQINAPADFHVERIDLTGIAKGIYFMNIYNSNTKLEQKLIIQ
jgi:photosystem II stability/assembly factor-like uncharacterized protein